MQRALVVVEPTDESREMIREAGELAAGIEADLVLLHVTTEDEYEEKREQLSDIASGGQSYSVSKAREGARQFAENLGYDELEDLDVEFDAVGAIGDKRDRVLDVARTRNCDYVFLLGKRRSPTGKALFGDATQSIILNFEGAVVVQTE